MLMFIFLCREMDQFWEKDGALVLLCVSMGVESEISSCSILLL